MPPPASASIAISVVSIPILEYGQINVPTADNAVTSNARRSAISRRQSNTKIAITVNAAIAGSNSCRTVSRHR